MSRDRLIVNEVEIDLAPDTIIALNSQINNLAELKDHQSTYSLQFKIPLTKNNLSAFENSEQVQTSSVMPYRRNSATVIKEGVEVIQNGYIIIDARSGHELTCTVYKGNVDFFNVIEGLSIRDLDLSAYDHDFDFTEITDSRTHDYTDGYKYSIVDYGYFDSNLRVVDPADLRPLVFIAMLIDKIITEAGFTVEGDCMIDQNYLDLLLTTENNSDDTSYYDTFSRVQLNNETALQPLASNEYSRIAVETGEVWTFEFTIVFYIQAWVNTVSYFTVEIHDNSGGGATTQVAYDHSDADGDGTWTKTFSYTYGAAGDNHPKYVVIDINNCDVDFHGGDITGTRSTSGSPDFYLHIKPLLQILMSGTFDTVYLGYDKNLTYTFTNVSLSGILPDISQKS